jgi:hypothetical protein
VDVAGRAAGNPRLFLGPDGAVWLIAPINYGRGWCQGGSRLFLKRSFSEGSNWTDLELFLERKGVLGKNKPLHVPPSTWIIPVEHERTWQAAFLRSGDGGASWRLVERPSDARVHQPSIVRLASGELLAYMRSWEGRIMESRSTDEGLNWSEPRPTPLPNNNSGIDMERLGDGRLALVFNPTALGAKGDMESDLLQRGPRGGRASAKEMRRADEDEMGRLIHGRRAKASASRSCLPWGPRTPLALALSSDEGASWKISRQLETGEGEYSYPAIIQDSSSALHIAYTYKRISIKHVRLDAAEL